MQDGLRWWRDVSIRTSRSDTVTTARRVNTGSYRLERLGSAAFIGLKNRVRKDELIRLPPFAHTLSLLFIPERFEHYKQFVVT